MQPNRSANTMIDMSSIASSTPILAANGDEHPVPAINPRRRRVDAILAQYGELSHNAAALTALLSDLRHWCDSQTVAFGTLPDASFVAYMIDKFGGLKEIRDSRHLQPLRRQYA
jgi:hypothetical protein